MIQRDHHIVVLGDIVGDVVRANWASAWANQTTGCVDQNSGNLSATALVLGASLAMKGEKVKTF